MILFFFILFVISWMINIRGSTDHQLACGLFGFSGKRPVDETKLRFLAVENEKRGNDSTGVYGNHLYKNAVKASEFILDPGFRQAIKGAHTIVGHTRAATKGSVTTQNAHPYLYGPGEDDRKDWKDWAVGAHNGFVIDDLDRYHNKELGFTKNFDVDSQIIFAALAKFGDVDIISKIEGAMGIAFMFPHTHPDTLFLYKREETRSLHIGEASDGIYYSSSDMPLRYIGCKTVWALAPNVLYSIVKGQITDMYRMPDPILKSLAANVQRHSWRQGLPNVEINALPTGALLTTHHRATYSNYSKGKKGEYNDWSKGQLGFENYDFRKNNSDNTALDSKLAEKIINSYSNKESASSVEAKFNLFVNNIRQELKNMSVTTLQIGETTSRTIDDFASCFLGVTIKTKEHSRGLGAWYVGSEQDVDISGLTSLNGYTIMKVPSKYCNQKLKLRAYGPIDSIGPYEFEITPEIGRVMEVTLQIPFRQKDEKEEEETRDKELESYEATRGGGSLESSIYIPITESGELHVGPAKENRRLLLGPAPFIRGEHSGQQTNGDKASQRNTPEFVPKTKLSLLDDLDPILDAKTVQLKTNGLTYPNCLLVPTIPDATKKLELIDKLIETTGQGMYVNFKDIKSEIWQWSLHHKDFHVWMNFYKTMFENEINAFNLVLDAARIQTYDRQMHKAWYKIHIYIETLLMHRWFEYAKTEYLEKHPYTLAQSFYPSTIISSGYDVENAKKKVEIKTWRIRPLFLTFSKYFLWRASTKSVYEMKKKDINDIQAHADRMADMIDRMNEVLAKDTDVSETDLRELLIEARNFFKFEKEDIDDFISVCTSAALEKLNLSGRD